MPKIKQAIKEIEGQVIKAWEAPSSTEHGTKHYIIAILEPSVKAKIDDGVSAPTTGSISKIAFICSCKGQQYNSVCWHVEDAKEEMMNGY